MKLDPEKFYTIKLAEMMQTHVQLQLEIVQLQDNLARVMIENSLLKKQVLQVKAKETQAKFDALAEGLKLDGTPIENVDWESGEIRDPSSAS